MSVTNPTAELLHLLSVAKVIIRYEGTQALARGEEFNIFDVLQIGHYEVTTHSRILAELLNPKGSHGQGPVFLRHFLSVIKIRDFDVEGALVKTEESVGALGRIDIVITDRSRENVIYIENKIYANLQDRQLERYQEHNPKACILYLTLNGDEPSGTNIHEVPNLKLISYGYDILEWLENCRREAVIIPSVREAITHYIQLVRRLTNQNSSSRMNQELIKVVNNSKESYLAYATLRNAESEVKKDLITRLNAHLQDYAAKHGLEVIETLGFYGKTNEACFFTTPALKNANLKFGICCETGNYRDVFFGVAFITANVGSPLQSQIEYTFNRNIGQTENPTGFWPAWMWWTQHRYWNDETWSDVISGKFLEDISELLSKLYTVATQALNQSPQSLHAANPTSEVK